MSPGPGAGISGSSPALPPKPTGPPPARPILLLIHIRPDDFGAYFPGAGAASENRRNGLRALPADPRQLP
jgi:hypothetical protein